MPEGRYPRPAAPAGSATVVPISAAQARPPGSSYCLVELLSVPVLVVKMEGRVYLFPPDILPLAPDLLPVDPSSLARMGAGVDITALFGSGLPAALAQAVLAARARHHAVLAGNGRRRRRTTGRDSS